MPKPNSPRGRQEGRPPIQASARPASSQIEPRWLIQAIAVCLLAAVLLGYLSVCLLVYLGGWQRMIFPVHTVDKTPAAAGIAFDAVRFDAATTGVPRLTGWWVPADSSSAPTVLLLHDAHGSLAQTVRTVALLHQGGVNVFAPDYRGFGLSDPTHPSEEHMQQDAAAALDYLVSTRHVPAARTVVYGQGLGTVLAARLATAQPGIAAVMLENPDLDAFERVADESNARLLPMRQLIRDRFDLPEAVSGLKCPALLIADTPFGYERDRMLRNEAFFRQVTAPKMSVAFANPHSEAAYVATLRRFLDEYVPN